MFPQKLYLCVIGIRSRPPLRELLFYNSERTGNHHYRHKNETCLVVFLGWEYKWVCNFSPPELVSTRTHYYKTNQLIWRKLIQTSPCTKCFWRFVSCENTHVAKPCFASGLSRFCLCSFVPYSISLCHYVFMPLWLFCFILSILHNPSCYFL